MNWILLITAGLLEVAWAYGLKQSNGFTKPHISFFTILTMAALLESKQSIGKAV